MTDQYTIDAEIAAALVEAQAEMPTPTLDQVNPHFNSRFTSLTELIQTVKPVLAKHGLSFYWMTRPNGEVGIQMFHKSGQVLMTQWVNIPPTKQDPQGIKSAHTYARRILLESVAAVCGDTDDDANAASRPSEGVSGDPGEHRMGGGKYAGQTVAEIWRVDPDYVEWTAANRSNYDSGKACQAYLNLEGSTDEKAETTPPF